MLKKIYAIAAIILVCIAMSPLYGEAREAAKAGQDASSPTNPYHKWWYYPATVQDPIPDQLLYHIEGIYSYGDSSGNTDEYKHKGRVGVILRKDRLTSKTNYRVIKSRTTVLAAQSTTQTETQAFSQIFTYDWLRFLSLEAGGMWSKDSDVLIGDRRTIFGGIVVPLLLKPKHVLSLGVYYGGEQTRYMNGDLTTYFNMQQSEFKSDALYFLQKFQWLLSDRVHIGEVFSYLYYFDHHSEYSQDGVQHTLDHNFNRWNLDVGVDVGIFENISLNLTYTVKYEKTPLVESFTDEVVKNQDTSITTGIKFAL